MAKYNPRNTYYITAINATATKATKQSSQLPKATSWALRSSSNFFVSDVASDDEADDDFQSTRWTRLQADGAHISTRVVKVAARETPPTLRD